MLDRNVAFHDPGVVANRRSFCAASGVPYSQSVYQLICYGDQYPYDVLKEVTYLDTTTYTPDVYADGLVTAQPGVALFLPVADCVATVLYDPARRLLAMLHLGRHSTLTDLVPKTVNYFVDKGSLPSDILVWMSPSAKKDTYKLAWFDRQKDEAWQPFVVRKDDGVCIDLPGYNRSRLLAAGITQDNIYISPVDTVLDDDYFSHSIGDAGGRIAVVAMMR